MKIYTQTYEEKSTQAGMCLKRLKSRLFIRRLFKSTEEKENQHKIFG